jgi:hypothetical protein
MESELITPVSSEMSVSPGTIAAAVSKRNERARLQAEVKFKQESFVKRERVYQLKIEVEFVSLMDRSPRAVGPTTSTLRPKRRSSKKKEKKEHRG